MQPSAEQKQNFNFHTEETAVPTATEPAGAAEQPQKPDEPVTWTASEFIAHHKPVSWYAMLVFGVVTLCTLIYLVTNDIISVVAITIVIILYLIISKAKPQQRTYIVDHQGISIDSKFHPYHDFKSFTVAQDGAVGRIDFFPLKRLMPEVSVFFAPQDGSKIFDVLASNLPNEQRAERKGDRLMKKLHF